MPAIKLIAAPNMGDVDGFDLSDYPLNQTATATRDGFVFVNVVGLIVAWPMAKQILKIFTANKNITIAILVIFMLLLNTYLGILDYRVWFWSICLIVFSALGFLIKKYETIPLIFMFILGNDIEGVFYRQLII